MRQIAQYALGLACIGRVVDQDAHALEGVGILKLFDAGIGGFDRGRGRLEHDQHTVGLGGEWRERTLLVEYSVNDEKDVARAVQEAVGQSEILLAHPDPVVFNPQSIQSVLLTSYRSRVPLLGFSPAYTRAGALASLHSTIPQMAAQAAEMVRTAMQTGNLPAAQYPRDFEVSVNRQVARSLGVDMPPEHVLVERVRQKERGQ